jgi:cytochrome b
MSDPSSLVRVWDPWVRVGHWILVAAFLTAYLTQGEPEQVHVVAGYAVGGYVAWRVLWGFIGPPHARFADFVRGPGTVLSHLAGLAGGHPVRHLGHNPAGGAMIVALLTCLATTALLGLATNADAEHKGPLSPWLGRASPPHVVAGGTATRAVGSSGAGDATRLSRRYGEEDEGDDADGGEEERESVFAEWHEFFANLTMALVLIHVLGVIVDSVLHRENLVAAMWTGRKRAASGPLRAGSSETAGRT